MSVLVDTSIWIDYFRSGVESSNLDILIDENLIVINDLILAELIPFLRMRKQTALIALLNSVEKSILAIEWEKIIELQFLCLQHGINNVGIPDLIVVQNALESSLSIYTLDKHFKLISKHTRLELYL